MFSQKFLKLGTAIRLFVKFKKTAKKSKAWHYNCYSFFYEGDNLNISKYRTKSLLNYFIKQTPSYYHIFENSLEELHMYYFLRLDMCHCTSIWRLIKGYPINGQSTHTNAKTAKKNKLFLQFRLDQFYDYFNKKKPFNFNTIVSSEYTNRLWYYIWWIEWLEARLFLYKIANPRTNRVVVDFSLLAKNITTGYTRTGAAAKIGKKKQITKIGTIGLPIFFSKTYFMNKFAFNFPFLLATTTSEQKLRRLKNRPKALKKKIKKKKIKKKII